MNAVKDNSLPSGFWRSLLHKVARAIESTPPLMARPSFLVSWSVAHYLDLSMWFVSYQCEASLICRTIVAGEQLLADQQLRQQLAAISMLL